MEALTTGGRIQESALHRLELPLPPSSRVEVSAGQRVEAGTILAFVAGTLRRLRLPAAIQGSPDFRKQAGDRVQAGETIVVSQSHFGLGLVEYVSPVHGTVEAIQERFLLIRGLQEPVKAHFPATVTAVAAGRGISLQAGGDVIRGFAGSGGAVSGPLRILGDLFHPTQVRNRITPDLAGAIAATTSELSRDALERLAACGACGLITPSLAWSEWSHFTQDTSPLTIVITETLGTPALPAPTRTLLEAHEGKTVYLHGGGGRERAPDIFFPREEMDGKHMISSDPATFRVLAGPLTGQWVTLSPTRGRYMELPSGHQEWAVHVTATEGEPAWVPLCNLELITGSGTAVPERARKGETALPRQDAPEQGSRSC